nr:hypothetical protein K-LCC10_0497 [Kaumoebavirus]
MDLPADMINELVGYCDEESARKLARTCRELSRWPSIVEVVEKGAKGKIERHIYRREYFSKEIAHFIRRYPGAFNYDLYLKCGRRDKEIIREFRNQVPWQILSWAHQCSREFVEVYDEIDAVDWAVVSFNLDEGDVEWVEKYKDKMNWAGFCGYNYIEPVIVRRYGKYIDWQAMTSGNCVCKEFVDRYWDKLDWEVLSRRRDIMWLDTKWYGKINMEVCPVRGYLEAKLADAKRERREWISWTLKIAAFWAAIVISGQIFKS